MADDMPYELMSNGEPTGVVELPVEWLLDDYPYFGNTVFQEDGTRKPRRMPWLERKKVLGR